MVLRGSSMRSAGIGQNGQSEVARCSAAPYRRSSRSAGTAWTADLRSASRGSAKPTAMTPRHANAFRTGFNANGATCAEPAFFCDRRDVPILFLDVLPVGAGVVRRNPDGRTIWPSRVAEPRRPVRVADSSGRQSARRQRSPPQSASAAFGTSTALSRPSASDSETLSSTPA